MRIEQTLLIGRSKVTCAAVCTLTDSELCSVTVEVRGGKGYSVSDTPISQWQSVLPLLDQTIINGHYSAYAEQLPVMVDQSDMIHIESFGVLTRAQAKLLSRTLHGTFKQAA